MFHSFDCSASGPGHYYVVAKAETEEEARTAIATLQVAPPILGCRLVSQYEDGDIEALVISPEFHNSLARTGLAIKYFPPKSR